MEENNQKKKKNVVDFSVVLSFAVAFFAIFSITTFAVVETQGSNVSYAAGNTFVLDIPQVENEADYIIVGEPVANGSPVKQFWFEDYFTRDGGERIFCVDRPAEVANGQEYTMGEQVKDPGILYILNYYKTHQVNMETTNGMPSTVIDAYIASAAIWLYLYEKNGSQNPERYFWAGTTDTPVDPTIERDLIKSDDVWIKRNKSDQTFTDVKNLYKNYIRPLVDAAKAAKTVEPTLALTVGSDEFVKTSDGNFYQTKSAISVTSSYSLKSYNVEISGVKGVKIVDENGKDMATTNISPSKKFYIRVPKDSVTEKIQTIKLNVKATAAGARAYYYTSGNFQTMVKLEEGELSVPREFQIVGSPSTGLNAAQTIYFIGLIVLICGIGIIYANAKPVEE